MNTYQISDLERLTGIKSHTLRIWERRYKLIEPHRTATNIRYYDDDQVKKLLKVSTLINQGMKISAISELSDRQLNTHIHDLDKGAPGDAIAAALINDLAASMLTFDEAAFEKVFSSAVVRFGMYEAMIRVFYPFLKKIGLMWSSDQSMPVQEHFASAIIRRKLIVAIDGLPAPSKKSKTFLLFLPTDEWHETGLLLSDYIIRSRGFKTVYLSQNVPLSNLQNVIDNTKPTHLLTLYIARQGLKKLHTEMHGVATRNKNCQVWIAGSEALIKNVKKAKNITMLFSPVDLIHLLKH
jgi:MerR family transcriptional regulator, light-induced transcriptional regulator